MNSLQTYLNKYEMELETTLGYGFNSIYECPRDTRVHLAALKNLCKEDSYLFLNDHDSIALTLTYLMTKVCEQPVLKEEIQQNIFEEIGKALVDQHQDEIDDDLMELQHDMGLFISHPKINPLLKQKLMRKKMRVAA